MDFNNDSGLLSNVAVISSSTNTVTLQSLGGVVLPSGATTDRPTFANGILRLNTTTGFVEASSNGSWIDIKDTSPLPPGGIAGDILIKNSATDYDASFASPATLTVDQTRKVVARCKNDTAVTIPKGTPVYETGISGSSFTVLVRPADAADPLKMPAVGVLTTDLLPATEGEMLVFGEIQGVDTTAFTGGDEIYVAAGGGYTNAKPSASNVAVQFLGIVTKIHATNGGGYMTGFGTIDLFKDGGGKYYGWNGASWDQLANKLDDLSDATITTPTLGQILQYDGSQWVNNSSSQPASAAGVISIWTLLSGSRYYHDFVHGLGTTNVVIQLYDIATNALVQADSLVLTDANTVRVTVVGNSKSLRIVVIANGMFIGSAGTAILEDIFANRPPAGVVDRLFLAYDTKVFYRDNGTSWDIMSASSGTVKSYTFYANSLDSPNTADFAVNALAPVISDPSNTAINVRSFSNLAEQGVGLMIPIPSGAQTVTFKIRGRPTTAPAAATTVTHKVYTRQVPTNAAMGPWSAASTFTPMPIPTNAFYQLYTQSYALSALGLVIGNTYHFELTRATGGLTNAWLVVEVVAEFT